MEIAESQTVSPREIPKVILEDKEQLYADLLAHKRALRDLRQQNTLLRTRLAHLQKSTSTRANVFPIAAKLEIFRLKDHAAGLSQDLRRLQQLPQVVRKTEFECQLQASRQQIKRLRAALQQQRANSSQIVALQRSRERLTQQNFELRQLVHTVVEENYRLKEELLNSQTQRSKVESSISRVQQRLRSRAYQEQRSKGREEQEDAKQYVKSLAQSMRLETDIKQAWTNTEEKRYQPSQCQTQSLILLSKALRIVGQGSPTALSPLQPCPPQMPKAEASFLFLARRLQCKGIEISVVKRLLQQHLAISGVDTISTMLAEQPFLLDSHDRNTLGRQLLEGKPQPALLQVRFIKRLGRLLSQEQVAQFLIKAKTFTAERKSVVEAALRRLFDSGRKDYESVDGCLAGLGLSLAQRKAILGWVANQSLNSLCLNLSTLRGQLMNG